MATTLFHSSLRWLINMVAVHQLRNNQISPVSQLAGKFSRFFQKRENFVRNFNSLTNGIAIFGAL